jgi:hypothetical protein
VSSRRARVRRAVCSLKHAVAYSNRHVVNGFMEKYGLSFREADAVFTETKKFLWLLVIARSRGNDPPFITDHILVIDEMWHNFMLHSADYRRYCDDCFGSYLDHEPTTKETRVRAAREYRRDPVGVEQRWQAEFRAELSVIYDELGSKTVLKWFKTYPRRYSRDRLEELRRKQADRSPLTRDHHGAA